MQGQRLSDQHLDRLVEVLDASAQHLDRLIEALDASAQHVDRLIEALDAYDGRCGHPD